MLKKLPLGVTTFKDIRDKKENYLYIDKTDIAFDLIDNGKYYFLSRPRRFGKSLFLDTLADIFLGKKELFKGLYIYDKWEWEEKYPVIRVSFNSGNFSLENGVNKRIIEILKDNQDDLSIECEDTSDVATCFKELIKKAYKKYNQKVVILIDEYDKPILDNITNIKMASKARDNLRVFYTTMKDQDQYIKFVFMAGVSKFSKMNLFSGLNNLQDITIMKKYSTICGYTHNDIKTTFKEHLKGVDLDKLKEWYNGYNYFGNAVYNPYDILLFISNEYEYRNYWWGTGNPRFLIEKLKTSSYNIPQMESIITNAETLDSFDIEYIDLVALLWQTGYLTFDKKIIEDDIIEYKLKVPNKEIQISLNTLFIEYLTNQNADIIIHKRNLRKFLKEGDLENLKTTLISLFASIPYNNYVKNELSHYEGYYATVVFTYLVSLGFECITEDATNKGRIDLTIKLPNRIVIIEFKVDIKEKALKQIKERKYYEKYKDDKREIFIVGICFSSEDKNITQFEFERVKN
ncbi:MAG: AAA family ATPase [Campylobacterales bacterium]